MTAPKNVFFWNTNRSPAEPDGGAGQDCVFIYKDESGGEMTNRDNAWGDDGCNKNHNYICGEPAYVLVPDVENQCIDATQAPVSLNWAEVTAINKTTETVNGPITCTADSGGGTSITLTGGDFGLGSHTINCSVTFSDSSSDSSSFTFAVAASPSLTVPTVSTQTLGTGQSTVTVVWAEVTATNSDAQPITCSDSGDGTGLSVTGGDFGLGSHTVTCNVTNSDGCTAAESFTFEVTESTPTTAEPSTMQPTTVGPTTQANQPTTDGPTTQANQPTTEGPTTQANQPTTDGPTTQANQPTTDGPTTQGPTTQANQPTTEGPTTQANQPTTEGLTTQGNQPTTEGPTTQANQPTTEGLTTQANQPTTEGLTTQGNQPTTEGPTTQANQPTTEGPTTQANQPTTEGPTTQANQPTTEGPTTQANQPTTDGPTTQGPTTQANQPTTEGPTTQDNQPTTEGPTTQANQPTTDGPTTQGNQPTTEGQTTQANQPTTEGPTTQANQPTTDGPTTQGNQPTTEGQTTQANQPTTDLEGPTTQGPVSATTMQSSTPGLRSVNIVLSIVGVNNTALNSSDFTDPNSAASMELAELVARVIASVLGENATTSDIESVSGAISIGPDGVVFTGDVFVPVDSPVTADTIMEVLSNQAAAAPLTDGQSTLDVDPAVTAMDEDNCDPNPCMNGGSCADGINSYVCTCVEGFTENDCETGLRSVNIVLNIVGVNGTNLNTSDLTDPNSAASMELAELVARVIASVLGENATTSDVESVIGGISIGPDGVVFTGDVFVPVDSPVTAETIMEVLSNQAAAAPLTDGQSTLHVDPAVTAMDEDNCDPNPCMNGGSCTDGVNSYVCTCVEGFTGNDCEIGLRSVTIVLNVRGVNGTALISSDFTDPNSAASMELAELVARVIASVLGENATTSDVESVIGGISVGPDGVVFTGDVFVPVDSPVTAETIMEVLSNQAAAAPLTDGQSTLDVDPAVTAMDEDNCDPNPCMNGGSCTDGVNSYICTCAEGFTGNDCEIGLRSVTIVLNVRGVNGTALISSDFTDPNSAASMELAELVARVIASVLGENATTSDVESVIGGISVGPDGVVFTGDVFVPVDSPVTADTIMEVLSNQAAAAPLTDGQSTLDVDPAVTAMDEDNCDPNPCMNGGSCADGVNSYVCTCVEGFTGSDCEIGLRSVTIVLNVRGVNGTALNSSDFTDPNSAASMELAELVARVIASVLGENTTTSDVESVIGGISVGPDGVVFTGDVFVPVDSPVTAETIMEVLSNQAAAAPLTDGQSTLNVDPAVTAMDEDNCDPNPCMNGGSCADGVNSYVCTCVEGFTGNDCEIGLRSVTIVLNVKGVNGTALVSSDFTDPNSAASMELAELVARVIASVLGENATTSDVESVSGAISIGPDGVVFTGDVFVPVDSPVTAETIMEVLSNQAAAAPLTDGQSTLDVDPAVTARDEDNCDPNPCMNGGSCTDGVNSYVCACVEGFTGHDCEIGVRSVTVVLNVRGVNGSALDPADYTDPNSAASRELADLVARVIASVLGENATTSDVESVIGGISVGPDGVVFTGDVFVPVDSPVTAETIMEVLSSQAAAAPLTDGQSSLDVDPAVTARDNCDPNPCMNGGSCQDGTNSYVCTCVEGFTGNECEIDIDDCDPDPCMNGGACHDGVNSYTCTCVEGFTGSDCETDIDDCNPNPCLSGETCEDGINRFTCTCIQRNCQTDPCVLNPGLCAATPGQYCLPVPFSELPARYRCACRELDGYFWDSSANRCTQNGFRAVTIEMNVEGINGTALGLGDISTPGLLAVVAKVIQSELGLMPATSDINQVHPVQLVVRDGRVMFMGVVQVPAESTITARVIESMLSTLSSSRALTDGQTTLNVDPQVTAMVSTTACPPNFCQNGGTCDVSGNYPAFDYTCRCATAFTGSNCESVIPVPTEKPVTFAPTMAPGDSMSLLTAVLILLAVIALLLVLSCLCCFLALRLRRRRRRYPVYERRVMYAYFNPVAGRTMKRPEFVTPYVASGQEARNYYDQRAFEGKYPVAGRVVKNPILAEASV
ncbi:neurogenic locus notch homolog protein 2-like [Patiria miniata]|uniref:EGF-like domain-containing protein n=1 Tax=Patiria miniata TaxID=46514 RepID=A0A913ZMJ4_PATMI|nr:neurogenic locus notch homolog protein 2-like [Patiria miniata]